MSARLDSTGLRRVAIIKRRYAANGNNGDNKNSNHKNSNNDLQSGGLFFMATLRVDHATQG